MRRHTLLFVFAGLFALAIPMTSVAQDNGDSKKAGDSTDKTADEDTSKDKSPPAGPSVEELRKKEDIDNEPREVGRLYFDQKYPEGEAAVKLAGDAIDGTEIVMMRAENIARRQGQSLKGLRTMHVYQLAARKAVDADKAPTAVYLTLRARGYARDLVLANNKQLPSELEGTDAEDAKEAGGVTDEDIKPFVKSAHEEVGTAEEILETK